MSTAAQRFGGQKTFVNGIVAQSPLGANAADVLNKIGSSLPDASIVQNAQLLSVRGGLGGSEVTYAQFRKPGASFGNVLRLDAQGFTNCSAVELIGQNGGKNGIGFNDDGSGYIGVGSGFFDFVMTNHLYRFIANSAAFSASPLACFLFDLASAEDTPAMMLRVPSTWNVGNKDMMKWRIGNTDVTRIDSAGNFITPNITMGTNGNINFGYQSLQEGGGLFFFGQRIGYGASFPIGGIVFRPGVGSLASGDAGFIVTYATDQTTPGAQLQAWYKDNAVTKKSFINIDGEYEITAVSKGVIIRSPDGTRYRIKVANGGALSTEAA